MCKDILCHRSKCTNKMDVFGWGYMEKSIKYLWLNQIECDAFNIINTFFSTLFSWCYKHIFHILYVSFFYLPFFAIFLSIRIKGKMLFYIHQFKMHNFEFYILHLGTLTSHLEHTHTHHMASTHSPTHSHTHTLTLYII